MKYVGLVIIMVMVCSLISSVGLMNIQEPEINISMDDVDVDLLSKDQNLDLSIDSNVNSLPGEGNWFIGETVNTTWNLASAYIDVNDVNLYLKNQGDGWVLNEYAMDVFTRNDDGDYGMTTCNNSAGVDEYTDYRFFTSFSLPATSPGILHYDFFGQIHTVGDGIQNSSMHAGTFNVVSKYIANNGEIQFYIQLIYWWVNPSVHYHGIWFGIFNWQTEIYDWIASSAITASGDLYGFLCWIDLMKYETDSLNAQIASNYRYVSEDITEHRIELENSVSAYDVELAVPLGWILTSVNPSADYLKSGNNYVISGILPLTRYEIDFKMENNYVMALEEISYLYLADLNLESGDDWQQNTSQNFDSISLDSSIVAYGAKSLKLVDTDNDTDAINITSALPKGVCFASVKFYIESLEGNFTFNYYNGSWQKFYLQNTTDRWVVFQDEINITDDSFSNVAFSVEGNGIIYIDGFRLYNTTMKAFTSAFQKTKVEGYIKVWDSLNDPSLSYENIIVYLKNNTDILETWSKTTDNLGYFSVFSNYSFTANQYHIEVVTSTTSLAQNSSTTYLIPDYDFPTNYAQTVLHTTMDEGSGTNVSDSSGNGHHGHGNGLGWVNGINGSALDFERSSFHYVNFTDHDDFSFTNGTHDLPFTIEFWMNLESNDLEQYVLAKWDYSGAYPEYRIFIYSNGKLQLRLFNNDSGSDYIGIASNTVFSVDTWYYIVLTYNGNETGEGCTLYVNGTNDNALPYGEGTYAGMTNGDAVLEFGRTLTTNHFDGILDDVRIHKNKTLSASQIAARFTNYSYYDYSRGEYYTYASSSTSKYVQQKSYFTALNIFLTASISFSEFATYFLIESTNESLVSRVWMDTIFSGDYAIAQPILKNSSLGTHNFSYIVFMGDAKHVYLPTNLQTYVYQVSLEFAVAALLFSYDASFGIISTTYYSTWGNTTHRIADNGTWLADAQNEGSFTWSFTTDVGVHNITLHIYNNATEIDVIEFSFTILAPLVYWQVFFTFKDQSNLPLYFEFGKVYVNSTQQLSQYLTVLNGSLLNVNITDNFNQNLHNQSHTITSDLTIAVNVTVHQIIFLNAGDYPSEVVVYKDDVDGYNFTIPSKGGQPLYFLAGNYDYQVYYRAIQSIQSGVTIVESAKTKYGDLRQFSVSDDYALYVDASSPSKPVDTTAAVSPLSATVFNFVSFLLIGGLIVIALLGILNLWRGGRTKVIEREVIRDEKTK